MAFKKVKKILLLYNIMINIPVLPSVLSQLVLGYLDWDDHAYINDKIQDSSKYQYAARNGYIELITYFRENTGAHNMYPWGVDTCASAASSGRLDCLKYLHENGCPWDSDTCHAAARAGYIECLKYANENGCPMGFSVGGQLSTTYRLRERIECLNYVIEHASYNR
jgi:hypothetical protein